MSQIGAATTGRRVIDLTDQKLANPNPDFFSYTMSKNALAATVPMMAMAADPADRVYALAPGAILPSHDQSAAESEISHRMNLLRRRTNIEEVADAKLEKETDALVRVTSTNICGSDLHMYEGRTSVEKGNPDAVLDGELDEFMAAALAQRVGATRSDASAAAR